MIYRQKWIEREDLQNNPDVYFLFGDNVKRKGMGGQAGAMRGEPNAIGIATKWAPNNRKESFFSDENYLTIVDIIDRDFSEVYKMIKENKNIVIPSDGLGTGLSKLPEKAPMVDSYLNSCIYRMYGIIITTRETTCENYTRME